MFPKWGKCCCGRRTHFRRKVPFKWWTHFRIPRVSFLTLDAKIHPHPAPFSRYHFFTSFFVRETIIIIGRVPFFREKKNDEKSCVISFSKSLFSFAPPSKKKRSHFDVCHSCQNFCNLIDKLWHYRNIWYQKSIFSSSKAFFSASNPTAAIKFFF